MAVSFIGGGNRSTRRKPPFFIDACEILTLPSIYICYIVIYNIRMLVKLFCHRRNRTRWYDIFRNRTLGPAMVEETGVPGENHHFL
jgi:hypothetical protein